MLGGFGVDIPGDLHGNFRGDFRGDVRGDVRGDFRGEAPAVPVSSTVPVSKYSSKTPSDGNS